MTFKDYLKQKILKIGILLIFDPFEIFNSPINSGNRLIIFSNKPYIISKRLKKLIEDEKENKVNTLNSWINFANKAKEHKLQFINLLKQNFQNKTTFR